MVSSQCIQILNAHAAHRKLILCYVSISPHSLCSQWMRWAECLIPKTQDQRTWRQISRNHLIWRGEKKDLSPLARGTISSSLTYESLESQKERKGDRKILEEIVAENCSNLLKGKLTVWWRSAKHKHDEYKENHTQAYKLQAVRKRGWGPWYEWQFYVQKEQGVLVHRHSSLNYTWRCMQFILCALNSNTKQTLNYSLWACLFFHSGMS